MSGADAGLLVAHCQARMFTRRPSWTSNPTCKDCWPVGNGTRPFGWRAVVVVAHLPPTETSEFRIHSLGSLREVPCMVEGCARCTEMRGGVRTVEGHAIFRMRVCGGPEQTPVPQTQRPGDRGVAAFDVPPYPPPPRVGTTGEFRWQVVPV